jgi:CheY-like chemotaxis protein
VGEGATFLLLFPAADTALPKPREKTPVPLIGSNGRNVLVVDDEAVILEYVGELVEGLGFKALLSASGREAIRIYESRSDVIDVVILDMIMPEMDGHEVFKALHAIDPDLRVIIASGSELDERSKRIVLNGPRFFLKKPFTLDELASAFASILGAAPNVY